MKDNGEKKNCAGLNITKMKMMIKNRNCKRKDIKIIMAIKIRQCTDRSMKNDNVDKDKQLHR